MLFTVTVLVRIVSMQECPLESDILAQEDMLTGLASVWTELFMADLDGASSCCVLRSVIDISTAY